MNFRSNRAPNFTWRRYLTGLAGYLAVIVLIGLVGCGSEVEQPITDSAATGHMGHHDSSQSDMMVEQRPLLETEIVRLSDGGTPYILSAYASQDSLVRHLGFEHLILRRQPSENLQQSDTSTYADYAGRFEFGRDLLVQDISGDGQAEIIIYTSAGGNDAVASDGLCVLQEVDGTIREAWRFNGGAPEIRKISANPAVLDVAGQDSAATPKVPAAADSTFVILLHREFWPLELSHAESIAFVDSLVFPANIPAEQVERLQHAWYADQSKLSLDRYKTALEAHVQDASDDSHAYNIYEAAVHFLVYSKRLPDSDLRPWFEIESGNWQAHLPADYITALNNLMFPANEAGEQM